MVICVDFGCVFEIGLVFCVEDFFIYWYLCEFIGFDFEMEIKEYYFEVVCDVMYWLIYEL